MEKYFWWTQHITVPLAKQEHAVPLTSPVWHFWWWAEATFLKDVLPGDIKGNKCRGKPPQKDLNCDFFYTCPLCFPHVDTCRTFCCICRVSIRIILGHPFITQCPYLLSNSVLTYFWRVSLTALMGMSVFHSEVYSGKDIVAETVRWTHVSRRMCFCSYIQAL